MADDFFRSRSASRLPDDLSPTQPGNSILGRRGYDGYYAAWLVAVVVHAAIVQGSLVADEHGSASFGDDHPAKLIRHVTAQRHGMEFHG